MSGVVMHSGSDLSICSPFKLLESLCVSKKCDLFIVQVLFAELSDGSPALKTIRLTFNRISEMFQLLFSSCCLTSFKLLQVIEISESLSFVS